MTTTVKAMVARILRRMVMLAGSASPGSQSRPDRTIRTTMINTRPKTPLGPCPQLLLCDQRGVDPTNKTMRMINNNVPVPMRSPSMVGLDPPDTTVVPVTLSGRCDRTHRRFFCWHGLERSRLGSVRGSLEPSSRCRACHPGNQLRRAGYHPVSERVQTAEAAEAMRCCGVRNAGGLPLSESTYEWR